MLLTRQSIVSFKLPVACNLRLLALCVNSARNFGLGVAYEFIPVNYDLCMQVQVRNICSFPLVTGVYRDSVIAVQNKG